MRDMADITLPSVTSICTDFEAVAEKLSLPGRGTKPVGASPGSSLPPEELRAPSQDLLENLIALMPNPDHVGRDQYVAVAHGVWGACRGTAFEALGRQLWLEWAGRYWASNPEEDARVYDTIRVSHSGWPHLMEHLRELDRVGWLLLRERLQPLRCAEAERQFADAPLPAEQQHLIAAEAEAGKDGSDSEPGGDKPKNRAERACRALSAVGAEFFCSPNGRAWVALAGRVYSLDSEHGFRAVLSWLYVHTEIAVTGNAKNELKDLLRQRAYVGDVRKVHYRQAEGAALDRPEAFINLMDGKGDGIAVDASGWRITPTSAMPVTFTDREGSLPLPRPVRSNDGVGLLDRLARHIPLHPIQTTDDPSDLGVQQRANLLAFLLNQFYRPGTAIHLFLNGSQASGKTSTARRLKDIADPDSAEVVSALPSDDSVVISFAQQQSVLVLDNLSTMQGDKADLFCGLATGTSQQRRALYTDGDRSIASAKCSVIFTSINGGLLHRADLRDRTVDMAMPTLDRKNRRTEAELQAAWEADKAHMLADLMDALSGGLVRLDAVRASTAPEDLPRFTDAALLAEAAAQGLGWKAGLCLAAINASRRNASEQQLEEHPYAYRVRALLEAEGGTWTGTVSELREKLWSMEGPEWGRANSSLSRFTANRDRLAGPLRETWGIHTSNWKGSRGTRVMKLSTDGEAG
ncbi:MAG: hypothetical protein ACXIVF_00010 [Rhizobiaceae bacterium]